MQNDDTKKMEITDNGSAAEESPEFLKKQSERLKSYYKYRNDYNKEHYERINLLVPPGTKDRIRAVTNGSLNSFILDCIEQILYKIETEQSEKVKEKQESGGKD